MSTGTDLARKGRRRKKVGWASGSRVSAALSERAGFPRSESHYSMRQCRDGRAPMCRPLSLGHREQVRLGPVPVVHINADGYPPIDVP